MLVLLNGRPGVGKLTIGRLLAERIGARLLDAHTLYNMAFAMTDRGTPAFEAAVRDLRSVARRLVLDLPTGVPVVLTDVKFEDSAWGNRLYDDTREWARARGGRFVVVVLDCAREENERRLRSPERMGKRKPMDGTLLSANRYERTPLRRDADLAFTLDVTALAPTDAAEWIVAELDRAQIPPPG